MLIGKNITVNLQPMKMNIVYAKTVKPAMIMLSTALYLKAVPIPMREYLKNRANYLH
jgi:hypothetical protein